jgi:acetate kinase
MVDAILALNVGSSSIKFSLFSVTQGDKPLSPLRRGEIDETGGSPRFAVRDAERSVFLDEQFSRDVAGALNREQALDALLRWVERQDTPYHLVAVGHRVAHGGMTFAHPTLVDDAALRHMEELIPLAPLHQPYSLAGIRAIARWRPDLPQVACFDTSFHWTQPPVAQVYALPERVTALGVKRYGFHGLSYEYIADVLPEWLGAAADGRVVVAHLGSGASMCAMRGRRSVASTMGFTALDGLPMSTRCGSLDPGVILYLLQQRGMDVAQVSDILYHDSGLLGVSGLSGDMRELLASDSPRAAAAIDLFVYRIALELGSLAAALGGLDALVFTAGIGEHAAPIRARVCEAATWLGVRLDEAANAAHGPRISPAGSAVSAWVIPTDEDWVIARHTAQVAGSRPTV